MKKKIKNLVITSIVILVLYFIIFGVYIQTNVKQYSEIRFAELQCQELSVRKRFGGWIFKSPQKYIFTKTDLVKNGLKFVAGNDDLIILKGHSLAKINNPSRFLDDLYLMFPESHYHTYLHGFYICDRETVIGEIFFADDGYTLLKIY